MNSRPIEEARDPDLRQSGPALRRAGQRARQIALQTGTAIVVRRNGVVVRIMPPQVSASLGAETPVAGYGDKT